jgi:RHS repeat-associated protein
MNVASGTRATLIPDVQGSFIGALDASAGTLTKYGYQTYGESGTTGGSFRYTGQRIDPETNGLYYYRARMYAPAWGRFMQADPIGYAGGANFYRYVRNDPLNLNDPYGFAPDSPQPQAGGAGGNVACTRFRRHRVRCFNGTGGGSWRGGSLHESSSLKRCG